MDTGLFFEGVDGVPFFAVDGCLQLRVDEPTEPAIAGDDDDA